MNVAIVTGGGSGLGAAIARRLASGGRHVVVADIDGEAADAVADEIVLGGAVATASTTDVTRDREVRALVTRATTFGPLDVLVLSAAVETRASVADTSDAEWAHVLDVNLKGPFLCMHHALPVMARGGGGSVVALGSTLGLIVSPGYAAYCASKGALVNLCKQAAIEHAADGIRVNVVAPSATDTGLFQKVADTAPDPDAVRAMVASRTPMGRLGTADDVCATVEYLVSPASAYLSGAVLPLDGAMAARRIV